MRPRLDVGDVVRCTTIKRDYLGDDNKPILQAGFKAGRGKRFMFVMIGVEDSKSPWTDLDVKQALRAIGLHSSEDQESAEAELARLRGQTPDYYLGDGTPLYAEPMPATKESK